MVLNRILRTPTLVMLVTDDEMGGQNQDPERPDELTESAHRRAVSQTLDRIYVPEVRMSRAIIPNVMTRTHYRTLVIEVGIGCNNHCLFCYQRGYRDVPGYPRWLGRDEIRTRLRWGVANGYDEVSFTGGEPTIRPDFLDLVRFAREVGFRRVAVTTNGWKLGQADFFEAAVEAGLTSMGVSIHGPDSATHEGLTGRPGSFARAIQAVRNAVRTHGSDRVVRLNTFTLVNRRNVDRLVELAILLHHLGVRLFVFQPIVLSKANFETASELLVGLAETVTAIRDVIREGIRLGFRTKLYNLPPCLFRDVISGVETDHYERTTFREHDRLAPADRSLGDEVGHVRLSACRECPLRAGCPGVPVSLLPQEDFVAALEEAIEGADPEAAGKRVWVAGTDMMKGWGVFRVVRKARLAGFEDVRVTTGGTSLAGRTLWTAATEAGATEVIFVHHGADPHSADRIVALEGNDRFLRKALREAVQEFHRGETRVGILVTPGRSSLSLIASLEPDIPWSRPPILHLRNPFLTTGQWRALAEFRAFLDGLDRSRFHGVLLEAIRPSRLDEVFSWPLLAWVARGRIRFSPTGLVLTTPFLDPRHAVLNWSDPRLGRSEAHSPPRLPVSRALRVRPLEVSGARFGDHL